MESCGLDSKPAELKCRAEAIAATIDQYDRILVHTQDLLLHDVWAAIPPDCHDVLLNMSFTELAHLAQEPEGARDLPTSLAQLFQLRHLALSRAPLSQAPCEALHDEERRMPTMGPRRPGSKPERRAKKRYEVEHMASVVQATATSMGCTRVLEVGCGMGILAAELANQGALDVIGLEAQAQLAAAAALPTREGAGSVRVWHHAIAPDKAAAGVLQDVCDQAWPPLLSSSKLSPTAASHAPVLACALHACGDLSPTLLRAFVGAPSLRGLVLVPCCYNLLTGCREAQHHALRCVRADDDDVVLCAATSPTTSTFTQCACDGVMEDHVAHQRNEHPSAERSARVPELAKSVASVEGFPLSEALQATGVHLSRNARMIACQREAAGLPPVWVADACAGRDGGIASSQQQKEAPPRALVHDLHTCLFAALVRKHFADLVGSTLRVSTGGYRKHRHVGAAVGGEAFAAFAQAALARAGLPASRLSSAELSNFATAEVGSDFTFALKRLAVMAAMRALLAPLIETLLLLDQLLFLHDHGVRCCAAVPVFDPSRSPRNMAILARKESEQRVD